MNQFSKLAHKLLKILYISFKSLTYLIQCGPLRLYHGIDYIYGLQGGLVSLKTGLPFDRDSNALPWFTYPSIEFLNQLDFKMCNVFEFGSGNGTQYWANHASSVTSVESDLEWFKRTNIQNGPNQTILYRVQLGDYVDSLESGPAPYDVIIIDGSWRYDCAVKAVTNIKEGGMIILDNSDWFPDTSKYLQENGYTQIDFIGLGPINTYAWSTSIFFKNYISIPRRSICSPVCVEAGIHQTVETDRPF